jgi:hypothetical protein
MHSVEPDGIPGGRMFEMCQAHLEHAPTPSETRMNRRTMVSSMSTFHEFEMTSITGGQVRFDQFDDQFCLIVNVASA